MIRTSQPSSPQHPRPFRVRIAALRRVALGALLLLALPLPALHAQGKAKAGEDLQWPPPPNEPRIKWVAEYRNEFDVGAKKRTSFMDRLTGKGQESLVLKRPLSVAVDEKGTIFVGDFGLGITAIDPVNHKMWRFADVSQRSLNAPAGVAADSKFVYATDANANALAVFDKQGHFIQGLTINDGLKRPVGVAVDEARDMVIVVNGGDHNILVYVAIAAVPHGYLSIFSTSYRNPAFLNTSRSSVPMRSMRMRLPQGSNLAAPRHWQPEISTCSWTHGKDSVL